MDAFFEDSKRARRSPESPTNKSYDGDDLNSMLPYRDDESATYSPKVVLSSPMQDEPEPEDQQQQEMDIDKERKEEEEGEEENKWVPPGGYQMISWNGEKPKELTMESLITRYPELKVTAQGEYKWTIDNWSKVIEMKYKEKLYSPEFSIGSQKFNILLFPCGNVERQVMSVFLNCMEPCDGVCAKFALSLVGAKIHSKEANHRFCSDESDWGFASFLPVGDATMYVENDCLVIAAHVQIVADETRTLWHKFINWDSKKETGYVGLKNQGATCYMNSLLQSLYFTNTFRKAVFMIPTNDEEYSNSVPLALQRVFYWLQHSDNAVGTTELTRSFGWDTLDSFMQHDVQELNRVLQDNLESKMKSTLAEGAIERLFVGKSKSYIKCVNVDYQSMRVEPYYDIQLNVKGCKTLEDSFREYVKVEMLDGENKYQAEGYGLQDAKMGIVFESFPAVLHLQLKRFEYDMMRDGMVKINDRHEFGICIDLDEFLDKEVNSGAATESATNDSANRNLFHLHGVLVHSGDVHGGHYCAFLRPTMDNQWFKFDDDRVVPVTLKEALEDNYGGQIDVTGMPQRMARLKKFTNAYMLVYIKDSEREKVLAPLDKNDIPQYLIDRFEQEARQEEQETRDREEAHYYLNVKVISTEFLIEKESFLDICSEDGPCMRVKKDELFGSVKHKLNLNNHRLWAVAKRQNNTWRPDCVLTDSSNSIPVEELKSQHNKATFDLILFAEKIVGVPVPVTDSTALLMIKYYDVDQKHLKFVGTIVCALTDRLADIASRLVEIAGMKGISVRLYEEVKPTMVESVRPSATVQASELGNGDIICFQRELTAAESLEAENNPFSLLLVTQYYDYQVNKVVVHFKGTELEFELELSKNMSYDQVAEIVAKRLNVEDYLFIRFSRGNFNMNSVNQGNSPIKRSQNTTLALMIAGYFQAPSETLYYEILDIPITELDTKVLLKIAVLDDHVRVTDVISLLVPTDSTFARVFEQLAPKYDYPIQIFETYSCRYWKELVADSVSSYNDTNTLYLCRQVPDPSIVVNHYSRDPSRCHGIPFKLPLIKDEPFSQTRDRIKDILACPDKEIARYKFTLVSRGQATPIDDDFVIADYDATLYEYLGLDHVDKFAKSGGRFEKAIKIHN